MSSLRRTAALGLTSLVLSIVSPSAADAGDREVCIFTEFDHPSTSYGLIVEVEKYSGRPSGRFHVGFHADGHVFASEWMSSTYVPTWGGLYIAHRIFYYRAGERYRVDLYLRKDFGVAYLQVQREYEFNFMGYSYWITLANEGYLVQGWVNLYPRGCNRGS